MQHHTNESVVESYMTINWKDILTNVLPQRNEMHTQKKINKMHRMNEMK